MTITKRCSRALFLGFILVLSFATIQLHAADRSVVVGVNVYDEGFISQTAQDAEIERLVQNGVKTIRTGLPSKSVYFITQAFRHGIGSVVIIFPTWGSQAKTKLRWSDAPLSGADPHGFAAWLKPLLDQLEAAGVRLTAMEFGNEINTSGYNGDIPVPGSGRVLGISDLSNPNDPEAPAIVAGYRVYLQVIAALKELRDHSTVNKSTPIISAGMADWGLPSPKAWNKQLGVSLPDTLAFLRQNGMDKLVDGYGVHVYPNGDPRMPISARVSELEQKKIFAECRQGTKPCWLTEWGISNSNPSCPINDGTRMQAIEAERSAFKQFVNQGRLAAIIYYTWSGVPGKLDPMSIFRCGDVTNAGKLAVSPM